MIPSNPRFPHPVPLPSERERETIAPGVSFITSVRQRISGSPPAKEKEKNPSSSLWGSFSSSAGLGVSLRRLLQWKVLGLLLLVSCLRVTGADLYVEAFDAANKLYAQGKFTESATAYEKLLKSGRRSPAVYFNLGNALFKAGQIGRAIAAYAEVERLTPRDPDVRANLQFARNQVQGPTLTIPAWERWLKRLSLNEWTFLAVATVWLWFALLITLQWRPDLKRFLRSYIFAFGVAVAMLCGCLFLAVRTDNFAKTAILIAPEATIRQGPLDESPSVFVAHDGAEFRILDHKDDWLQVSSDPRRVGWVRRDQVIVAPQS